MQGDLEHGASSFSLPHKRFEMKSTKCELESRRSADV